MIQTDSILQKKFFLLNPESKKNILKLSKNFFYLLLTNGTNFIIPIIIIPFLLSRLGIERFGLVMMAQALMTFLIIIPECLNIPGTQAVSVKRNNSAELEHIFNKVFASKLVLLLFSFMLLLIVVIVIPMFWQERTLYLFSFGMVVGKTLMPVWFLQGLEKMKYIVFANIIAKAFLLIFILKFINNTSAYLYVNLFYSFGDIVVGILGILFLKKISNIRFRFVSIRSIKQQLLSSWHLFISIIANSTYINSNILILGALTNNRVVGIYAVAEKAMLLLKQTAGIFLQATFPHACKLAEDSVVEFKNFLKKELCLLFIMFSIAGALMYLFAKEICVFFTKKEITQAIEYIKWLSPIPLIVALNIPAYQALIIKNEKKSFTTVITSGALISISLNFLLIPYLSTAGTIISIFVTEIFVTIGLHYALKYKHSHYTL